MDANFSLTLWTNDLELAQRADTAGVNRIGIDLEVLGKNNRQKGLETWISNHKEEDLIELRKVVKKAELFCRTNPINPNSSKEIKSLLNLGVEVLMLPMFTTTSEIIEFIDLVGNKAKIILLLETAKAVEEIKKITQIKGVAAIYLGLNDLSLSLGVANRYLALVSEEVEEIAKVITNAGIKLGIGGLAQAKAVNLPIVSDLHYAQFPRLGARGAILSRSFFLPDIKTVDLVKQVNLARERMAYWFAQSVEELELARQKYYETAKKINQW